MKLERNCKFIFNQLNEVQILIYLKSMRKIIQEKKENFGLEQRKKMRTDKFDSIRS